MKAWQNQYDYGDRVYDPRIGKFLSVDPLTNKFAFWSPYHFSGNNPIRFIDLDGAEPMTPFFKEFVQDVALTVTTKPNSGKAKFYGAAMGVGGAIETAAEGSVNLVLHPIESGKGLWRFMTRGPYLNTVDYAVSLAEKYQDLPAPVAESAMKAHLLTDLSMVFSILKKPFTSPKVTIGTAAGKQVTGAWVAESTKGWSQKAIAYQEHVTGVKAGNAFEVNGVKFDGVVKNVLQEAKSSYDNFISKTGEFYDWFKGADGLVDQAKRQLAAADGAPIEWHFSSEKSLKATQKLFKEKNVTGITLKHTPKP